MRQLAPALLLLAAACHSEYRHGRESYHDGMRALQYDPARAREEFRDAEADMALVLSEPDTATARRVTAASIRIRSLIELERHDDARQLSLQPIPGYDAARLYEGDLVGLTTIKIRAMDPERGLAELVLVERLATTLQARLHVAREQVHLLRALNTEKSRAEAARICAAHAGKLDFDTLKP